MANRLTATEIYRIARQAGFDPDQAVTMTAIALAESGGNKHALNKNANEQSIGLWQINVNAHGNKFGNLWDPLSNARAAYAISNGGKNIAPWTVTRTSKAQQKFNYYATWRPIAEQAAKAAGEGHLLKGTSYWGGTISYKTIRSATISPGGGGGAGPTAGPMAVAAAAKSPAKQREEWAAAAYAAAVGAGGGGGMPGAIGPPRLSPHATQAEIEQFVRENYGADMVGFMKIPELWNVVIQAGRDGVVDPMVLQSRFKATKWWNERSDSMRKWDILLVTDPAEAKRRKKAQAEVLRSVVEQTGANVNLDAFAEMTLRLGMNEQEQTEHIAGVLRTESRQVGLDRESMGAVTAERLQEIARNDFFIPLERQTAESWAIDIFRGTKTVEMFQAYLADLSRGRFNHIADRFAGGLTPGEYMAPIKQMVAEVLELNPGDIDLLDPRYAELLEYVDPTTGQSRPMTLAEAGRWARSRQEYRETQHANQASGELVELLGRTFGRVG